MAVDGSDSPPPGDRVELRVHGVHGTSPAIMLGVADSDVGQVAGDRLTGVYRVTSGKLPHRAGRDGVSVEAYSWGALTSGVQGLLGWVRRVLWLLLLPFALVNLAYWARIDLGSATEHGKDVWGARAVRLTGLLLTVFFVLSVSVVAVDLVGWQCYRGGVPGCSLPGAFDVLTRLTATGRLAVTSLLPLLAIAVLWLLSRSSLARYEDTPDPTRWSGPSPIADRPILRHAHLWNGRARTERLQRLHIAAALATAVAFTDLHLWHAASRDRTLLLLLVLLALAIMGAAAVLTLASHPHDIEHDESVPPWSRPSGWLPLTALGLYAVHLVVLLTRPRGGVAEGRDFYGHNLWFIVVFIAMTALSLAVFTGARMGKQATWAVVGAFLVGAILAGVLFLRGDFRGWVVAAAFVLSLGYLAGLNDWHYRHTPGHDHQAWRGASASTLLAAASWIALIFTSSAVIAAADYANGSEHSIADLVSAVPARPDVDPDAFVATGTVTLREATVVTDPAGGPVEVVGGTVEAEALSLPATADRAGTDYQGYTVGRGTTRIRRDATLRVPSNTVEFVDSCFTATAPSAAPTCTAESPDFRSGGTLTAPRAAVQVRPAGDGTVVLASRTPPQQPVVVPQVLIWLPIGQLVWLVAVALTVLGGILVYRRRAGAAIRDWLGPEEPVIPVRDQDACRARRVHAGLAHRAERFLDLIGVITVPVAVAVIIMSLTGKAPWALWPALRQVATAALWSTYAVSAGLVFLGSQIRRSESTRRAVGVLWDLTTFWPRAAHPLAPPCYAERVVPELLTRIRWALAAPGTDRVVLSGHSQGSLIVAAAASRLDDDELERVRVVTYGSQIRALYGRIFPAVVGPDDIGYEPTPGLVSFSRAAPEVPDPGAPEPGPPAPGSLRERLGEGGWVNLFRRTDPLGWRVFSDRDSAIDIPVPEVPPAAVGDPGPVVMTHSGYPHTRAYRLQVCAWVAEEVVAEPVGTVDLEPLPPL